MRALVLTLAMSVASAGSALAQQPDAAFASCAGCHSLAKGKNGIGPTLHGVVGAKKAAAPGYAYSSALKATGGTWTEAALDAYLTSPAVAVPGTKMPMGLKDPAKRAAVIAFLKTAR